MNEELTKHDPGQMARQQPRLFPVEIGEVIAAAIQDPSVDPARLQQFLDFKLRVDAIDAEKAFNADFAAAMMEMPRVVKRGKKDMGGKGIIAYETYDDLDAAIRPIETRHGFARTFLTRQADGRAGCVMILRLTHRAGHSITSERLAPPDPGPGRNDIQAQGSGDSYARRYMTKAIWNIVTIGADDDANSADPITEEQAMQIQEWLDYLKPTPKWFEQWWAWLDASGAVRTVCAIQARDFAKAAGDLRRRVAAEEKRRAGQ